MAKILIVRVLQTHIRKGERCRTDLCPIALAIGRGKFVAVRPKQTHVNFDIYTTPVRAKKFMQRFDTGKKVKPATFHFRLKEAF